MFWGVLNAFLGSLAGIFWKKSLTLSNLPENLFFALGVVWAFFLSVGILATGNFRLPPESWFLLLPVVDAYANAKIGYLQQKIYKEEKLTALMPFENVASILVLIAAFFLFWDTPVATLAIAIFTIALIFFATFDFKNRQFPKNFSLILLANGVSAGRSLMIGYALVQLTSPTFYSVRALIISAFAFLPILYFRQYGKFFEGDRQYLAPRLWASFLGAISALIAFTLVSKLGIVTTTLLGFFSMGATLIFSRFYLGERPEKKNLLLVIAVTSLVAAGTYFRIS